MRILQITAGAAGMYCGSCLHDNTLARALIELGHEVSLIPTYTPIRTDEVVDPNFAYWHSATFNNDGTKVLFTDEWGGGGQPKCRASDPYEWGANAIFTIDHARSR